LLPKEILSRRKQGFEVPLRELLLGPLAHLVESTLERTDIEAAGLDRQAVRQVRSRLASTNPGQAQATVHAMLVYLSWWRKNGAAHR
jgi:hypothetical protein